MHSAIILCLFAVGAYALPTPDAAVNPHIPILERTEVHDDFGQYALGYRSGDGTIVREQGALKPNQERTGYVLVKEGDYSFIADDGKTYTVMYIADHLGFRAVGDHLPKSVVA